MKLTIGILITCLALVSATPSEAKHRRHVDANANGITFLSHPTGCPHRLFCGCGAYYHITGKAIPRGTFAQAAYWPHHYHGPTPVAVWRGHVAVIDYWTGPHTAMVYDYNSGGHRSRHWERNLRGARIVGGSQHANLTRMY